MKIKQLLLLILPLLLILGSCKKSDPKEQANIDDAAILKFISEKGIIAEKHPSGVYYQILSLGAGSITYTTNTTVTTKYTGRLLNGTVFDGTTTSPISFKLGQVIGGWQIGIPLIQKGGKIRLLIPSALAYGPNGQGPIPGNAVLDFDIELIDVTN